MRQNALIPYLLSPPVPSTFFAMVAFANNQPRYQTRKRVSPKTHTPERQLHISGLRYDSPELGRWINRDPIGERGGGNLYVVNRNASLGSFDPFGLNAESFIHFMMPYARLDEHHEDMDNGVLWTTADMRVAHVSIIRDSNGEAQQSAGGVFFMRPEVSFASPTASVGGTTHWNCNLVNIYLVARVQSLTRDFSNVSGTRTFGYQLHSSGGGKMMAMLGGVYIGDLIPREVLEAHERGHAEPIFDKNVRDGIREKLYSEFSNYENRSLSRAQMFALQSSVKERIESIWDSEYRSSGNASADSATIQSMNSYVGSSSVEPPTGRVRMGDLLVDYQWTYTPNPQ